MRRSCFEVLGGVVVALGMFVTNSFGDAVPTEFQPNYDEGYGIGYPLGYGIGLGEGKERGWKEGTATGKTEGFSNGWSAAYSPAFDLGYDARFPVGHRAGWEDGVGDGFVEGFNYAPTIAAQILESWNNSSGSFGIMNWSSGTNLYASWPNSGSAGLYMSSGILTFTSPLSYDWAQHFYKEGYADGREIGQTDGSEAGYNLTYPTAYENAYKIAFLDGVGEGTHDGTRDGGRLGYDEGWDQGYDGGFDDGFYAGIDYHLYGGFVEPTYAFQYTRRSDAFAAQTLLALHAPEPTSLALLLVAGAIVAGARRERRG